MEKDKNTIIDSLRRFGIRTILELSQGVRVKGGDKKEEWLPDNIEEFPNNPYINREGIPLAMDIFKPVGPEYEGKELPVIVNVHGGGLVTGDRKIGLNFSRELASRGYLVFAIEYRLAPRATVCEQFDDVCAGMDYVGRKLVRFDVDFTRVFLTADSAGALLAVYTAAMKNSKKLQDAIGYEPSKMVFKAIGLSCGMFYTNRNDILGQMLSEQFFGDRLEDENFLQYMNPEHPEILNNLPPTFLVTSRGDFLNNYTVMYEKALKKAGKTTKMLYYPGEDLIHTFNFSRPWLPESKDANDKMLAFFEEQADIARDRKKNILQAKRKIKVISGKMGDGSFAKQRLWEAVLAANEISDERMDSVAVVDAHQKYTYRQMFHKWNDYAEVFSALKMTMADQARIGMPGAMTTDAIMSFYALNMTGAGISLMPYRLMRNPGLFLKMIKQEQLTGLILTDHQISISLLEILAKEKSNLGLKNIIIFQTPEGKKLSSSGAMHKMVHNIDGIDFMSDLIIKYEATRISCADPLVLDDEIILHKYSESRGECTPVEFTNEELNLFTFENVRKTEERLLVGYHRIGLSTDLSSSHALVKQLQMSLLLNNTVVTSYKTGYYKEFYKEVSRFQMNNLVIYPELMEIWMENLKDVKLSFSSLDTIYIEDVDLTEEKLARFEEFIRKNKGSAKVCVTAEQAKDFERVRVHYGTPDKVDTSQRVAAGMIPLTPYAPGVMTKQDKSFNDLTLEEKDEQRRRGRMETLKTAIPALVSLFKPGQDKNEESQDSGAALMKVLSKLFSANAVDYYYED